MMQPSIFRKEWSLIFLLCGLVFVSAQDDGRVVGGDSPSDASPVVS